MALSLVRKADTPLLVQTPVTTAPPISHSALVLQSPSTNSPNEKQQAFTPLTFIPPNQTRSASTNRGRGPPCLDEPWQWPPRLDLLTKNVRWGGVFRVVRSRGGGSSGRRSRRSSSSSTGDWSEWNCDVLLVFLLLLLLLLVLLLVLRPPFLTPPPRCALDLWTLLRRSWALALGGGFPKERRPLNSFNRTTTFFHPFWR